MATTIVAVFAIVCLGMILGGLPFLQLDRTGIALLGAALVIGALVVNNLYNRRLAAAMGVRA